MKTLSKKLFTALALTLGLGSAAQAVELYSDPIDARIEANGVGLEFRTLQCTVLNRSGSTRSIRVQLIETFSGRDVTSSVVGQCVNGGTASVFHNRGCSAVMGAFTSTAPVFCKVTVLGSSGDVRAVLEASDRSTGENRIRLPVR